MSSLRRLLCFRVSPREVASGHLPFSRQAINRRSGSESCVPAGRHDSVNAEQGSSEICFPPSAARNKWKRVFLFVSSVSPQQPRRVGCGETLATNRNTLFCLFVAAEGGKQIHCSSAPRSVCQYTGRKTVAQSNAGRLPLCGVSHRIKRGAELE